MQRLFPHRLHLLTRATTTFSHYSRIEGVLTQTLHRVVTCRHIAMPSAPSKRKAAPAASSSNTPAKKRAPHSSNGAHSEANESTSGSSRDPLIAEAVTVVNRTYYPPEMSQSRVQEYMTNARPRPLKALERTVADTASQRARIDGGDAVVHWFKRDLRLRDNRALSLASGAARKKGVPLVCVFLVSPQDYEAHVTSAARVDFELRALAVVREDLAQLDVPLFVETVEKRVQVPERIMGLCEEWGAKHVFCNVEYEVDELRREELLTRRCLEKGIDFTAVHDDVVVAPGKLQSGSGNQYAVYTPWYRSWVAHIHANPSLLEEFPKPTKNPSSARSTFKSIFDTPIPTAPSNKSLTSEQRKTFANLWPAGEHEAHDRLGKFLAQRIKSYNDTRNFPAQNTTSLLSVHLSTGTLAARSAVRAARDANSSKNLDSGARGAVVWISEVAWRDFYKHVLAHWPHVCMHTPFKAEYSALRWEHDPAAFEKWCNGMTGFPIVDAAMRQLKETGWMHNRCRMIVGSFLSKDLLLDWRLGERWFMLNLIDGDFASNNGGWGFSASVGVDPQPYFRIFNPLLQSERFDENGEYIRKWVNELKNIKGKAIHDPYGRGAVKEAEKNGYPRPMVDHGESRTRALERYKEIGKRD